MLLRPFYTKQSNFTEHVDFEKIAQLTKKLLIQPYDVRKHTLCNLNIRELLGLLMSLCKDIPNEDFYPPSTLDPSVSGLWEEVVAILNKFPCVKLVDIYSFASSSSSSYFENKEIPLETRKNEKYELAIDSSEYDFLLEYLLDCKYNQIKIPLIEVGTKKFTKISEVLENHCEGLQIQNDYLSVIKDSENLRAKLKKLYLHDYEHFETVTKLKCETLIVVGNEVDAFSLSTLVNMNENLKQLSFRGRLYSYIPLDINPNIKVSYGMLVFDTISESQLEKLGNLDCIEDLYMNFIIDSTLSLEWLKHCTKLKRLYFSLNFDTRLDQMLSESQFVSLRELTLRRCRPLMQGIGEDSTKFIPIAPKLEKLVLIDCDVDVVLLNRLIGPSLFELSLIDCTIRYNSFLKLPPRIKKLTLINHDVESVKDLMFLSYRSETKIPYKRRSCMLNVNDKLMTIKIPNNRELYLIKMDEYYDVIEINDEVNSKEEIINAVDTGYLSIPANSNLQLTIYPHFNSISLEFLKSLCEIFTIDRIKIELYSYTNDFKDFRDVDGELRKKLTIFKYDISQIQDVLKKLLVCNATAGEESRFLFPYISLERELTQVQDPRKNSDVEFESSTCLVPQPRAKTLCSTIERSPLVPFKRSSGSITATTTTTTTPTPTPTPQTSWASVNTATSTNSAVPQVKRARQVGC